MYKLSVATMQCVHYCRLKDEQPVCALLESLQTYVEKTGTSEEICRAYLRRIEHLYFKVSWTRGFIESSWNVSPNVCVWIVLDFVDWSFGRSLSWGWNSSVGNVLGWLSCVMQRCGVDPPLSFQQRGFFPWSWLWFWLHSPKTLSNEGINRGLVYGQAFHHMDSKDPDIHVLDRWIPATKTHLACTIHEDGMWLPEWLDLKNCHMWKDLTQNGVPQRSSWECRRRRRGLRSPASQPIVSF